MPPVSEKQRKAMWAAVEGRSKVGIPRSVGREFVGADSAPPAAGCMVTEPNGTILLVKRSDTARDHAGKWAFPGGGVEDGETPYDAALREMQEECGLPPDDLDIGEAALLDKSPGFWTYKLQVSKQFDPQLNSEHTESVWASPEGLPEPLHPGVARLMAAMGKYRGAHDGALRLALDRDSVRAYDADGHLHVREANISKAIVNPYRGDEIPGYEELGLEPKRIYKLLRDPGELAKGAASFHGKPLMLVHKPINSAEHPSEVVGGSVMNPRFDGKHLKAELVIWPQDAIDSIEDGSQKELSCGYRYRADMTPGRYEGEPYDGVMRDIVGNHVALVTEGRAGSDVVVGDSAENVKAAEQIHSQELSMASRKAVLLQGALTAALLPRLAQDAKLPDLGKLVERIDFSKFRASKPRIAQDVALVMKGRLAHDADLEDLPKLLDAFGQMEEIKGKDGGAVDPGQYEMKGRPPEGNAAAQEQATEALGNKTTSDAEEGADPVDQVMAMLEGKVDDETMAAIGELIASIGGAVQEHEGEEISEAAGEGEGEQSGVEGGEGEEDPPPFEASAEDEDLDEDEAKRRKDAEAKKDKEKQAMDSRKIQIAVDSAIAKERTRQRDIRMAFDHVRPLVGALDLDAKDASDVYKHVLDMHDIETKGVHPSAFRGMYDLFARTAQQRPQPRIAQDAAGNDAYAKMFPNAGRLR